MGSVREGIAESAEREQPCLQQERQIREGNKKIKGKKKKKKTPPKQIPRAGVAWGGDVGGGGEEIK